MKMPLKSFVLQWDKSVVFKLWVTSCVVRYMRQMNLMNLSKRQSQEFSLNPLLNEL